MSRAHQYHQSNALDSPEDSSDSDIELDIDELGPRRRNEQHDPEICPPWNQQSPESRIPLRNLRITRTRGFGGSGHEKHDHHSDGRDADREVGDSAPLLDSNDSSSIVPRPTDQDSRRHSSKHRFASFFSSAPNNGFTTSPETQESVTSGASRNISIGQYPPPRFPPNAVSNAKYTAWSFLPRTLYNEFSFFFNMYFLLVALSQLIPPLRIGYVSTYVVPLVFVLSITLGKEALDDIARRRRDAEANKEAYTVLRLYDPSKPSGRSRKHRTTKANFKRMRRKTSSPQPNRLDVIEEEEESLGQNSKLSKLGIKVDELRIRSRDIKVGDVVKLGKDQRVPADLVILQSSSAESGITTAVPQSPQANAFDSPSTDAVASPQIPKQDGTQTAAENVEPLEVSGKSTSNQSESTGEAFLRTDQLDGETDWKLRLASPLTQSLDPSEFARLRIVAGRPSKKVNDFVGTVEHLPNGDGSASTKPLSAPLTIDNTAWANTVLASNATVLGVVVYTGAQTRQAMSTSPPRSKTGLLDCEINNLTKILCALTLSLSITLVALEGFENQEEMKWYVAITRFLILFSTIIPISLRVNLDMGKSVYAWSIERDQGIPGTVVRTSTIPEELGRIEYLLSDKTGTLTQNEMELKKIHVGTVSYANEAMDEVASYIRQGFVSGPATDSLQRSSLVTPSSTFHNPSAGASATRTRREIGSRVRDLVLALALCHNVTPSVEEEDGRSFTTYQASSPDEIAIVRWTEQVGLRLIHRDRKSITLQSVETSQIVVRVRVLDVFPFTSEGKRMGIILQFDPGDDSVESAAEAGEKWFYQKGADTVMTSVVAANDWLDEETANMAREGFRTLVVGRRKLSARQYQDFSADYKEASLSLQSRDARMAHAVKKHLEVNLELLGVTGVEDKLQKDVKASLELLRNAGIKIWMLTGDKVETARCVAVSAKLVSRTQYIHTITKLTPATPAASALDALSLLRSKPDSTALLIDGDSLSYFLSHHRWEFISIAVQLPAVIACRCSPTQKADIAYLIRQFTKKRVACIGDGGNDVSMIQAADVGVGIVGKEGRQASLAADFSITSFHHLTKLLVWHGRNSYKRSAKLAQFIIHRGLIISVCQTIYSIAAHFEPNALYKDWLLVGYATVYTMAPVFSLVLDKDVDEGLANLYPELYKELTNGQSLSYRTFFVWVAVSIYQGSIIQGLSQILVGSVDSPQMVSVSFTVLIINELIMVASEIVTWHRIMVASLLGTMAIYVGSVPLLGGYFDLQYVWSWGFAWRVAAVSAISLIPPYSVKILRRTLKPPSYMKEIAFFSYDDAHQFHLDERSLRYYYPPRIGANLSKGFDSFEQLNDTVDDHIDSLLKTIIDLERRSGSRCQADVITWRGMMTKIMATPFDMFNGFIEENNAYKLESRRSQHQQPSQPGAPSQDLMSYWGYKFETLSLLPAPWAETSREYIETREDLTVNNHAQYCSIVKTGIGKSRLILGGEVDALWDAKPSSSSASTDPINWVELKTAATPHSDRDILKYERKLLKFWIQSFLLGVPKIIVGFRSRDGILESLEELEAGALPRMVKQRGKGTWDGNVCINFTACFLDWLKATIPSDESGGVWRIRKREKASVIELFKVEESGYGDILSREFVEWRSRPSKEEPQARRDAQA
ncbi:MAG: hypothetical protein Q9218_000863 [Villophora microphyllina]